MKNFLAVILTIVPISYAASQGYGPGAGGSTSITGSLPAGTNAIGSITNTAFGITGTLPAFAATPTFNIGTAPTIITNTTVTAALPAGSNTIGAVNAIPKATAAVTVAGCTVGITSAQCLASATAVNMLAIQNTSASASVACRWNGTAILNDPNSFMLSPGQARNFGTATSGVPNQALNCIASAASTPFYVEYN